MKKLFRVYVQEIHYQGYLVKAENSDEAKQLVSNEKGQIDEGDFCFSHKGDIKNWHTDIEVVN